MSAVTLAAPPVPFDVCGPLPTGTTVLEASAGTGKTYTIAALTARYVAEGRASLGELLLVTFGRMATSELRARVRERLVSTERALRAALDGDTAGTAHRAEDRAGDRVEALLVDAPPAELTRRHRRIRQALADFDAATIATTHEFCLQMLDGLGVLGDREPERRIVDHLTDLVHEVAGDVYLSRYAESAPPMPYDAARRLAEQAVEAGHARLVPAAPADVPEENWRELAAYEQSAFASAVRAEVERRKRERRLFSYDDMLTRLRDALADPEFGTAACRRLRDRFRVVLVDEFQDTDPVQWDILRRAFRPAVAEPAERTTMILIGDPKQAIYAFRGADVFSYLAAVDEADTVATLDTNWRSDAGLVEALQQLTGGASLGDPRIAVRPVSSAHPGSRLSGSGPAAAPLRLRVVVPDGEPGETPRVGPLRQRIEDDLVAEVIALLTSGARLRLPPGDPSAPGLPPAPDLLPAPDLQNVTAPDGADEPDRTRPVDPSDIAVLVRKNSRGEAIRDALIRAGVPAVLLSATSVFASPMAREWLTLLQTLEQPRQSGVRTAALTCFVGWTFADLARADDDRLNQLTWRIRSWSRLLARRGVAALLEAITGDTGLTERLLGQFGGERALTDLRHIGQSLHAAMQGRQLGISALVEWLRERIDEAESRSLDGSRRLDTEARCVQVLTVHASKGLEFPIVFLPEPWDTHVPDDEGQSLRLHERADGSPDDCLLDVGGLAGPGRRDRLEKSRREDAGEDLRLLYVALTRAQCQVVAWWAPSRNTPGSALQRFLYRDRQSTLAGAGAELRPSYPLAGDPRGLSTLGPQVAIEPVEPRPPARWQQPGGGPPALAVRSFDRTLDDEWRRTSYSALTAAAHGLDPVVAGVGSEPEVRVEDDEPLPTAPTPALPPTAEPADRATEAELGRASPMAGLPMGTEFGTLVHAVLEAVDPAAGDLLDALTTAAADALSRSSLALGPGQLAEALGPVLRTPLGPVADELSLAGIGARDRLAELDFELPLAGGDRPRADVRLRDVADLLAERLDPADPLAGYAVRLADPALSEQTLRGFLTGSIDAVLRVGSDAEATRYLVVDYKTNWLGALDGPELTLAAYAPERLSEAMMAAHYPLQALLYSVALHRLLRWRQPGYDPDRHLGGIAYLFVRGMAGPDTPRVGGVPCGVFGWRPPAGLVPALSELLDGGPMGGRP
ncbi:UvrD-helicase domain-containing protein [Microlunatus ginsengisoli]|uniref:RecBCD enzyme subunit RecB n=1 Tax=Microlunatus ginsengisoli TaxID=363863 RepID=A0ABP6ZZR8_9ACTN